MSALEDVAAKNGMLEQSKIPRFDGSQTNGNGANHSEAGTSAKSYTGSANLPGT